MRRKETTYRAAVADLFVVWHSEGLGVVYPRRNSWPCLLTSHGTDYAHAFDDRVVSSSTRKEETMPHRNHFDTLCPGCLAPVEEPHARDCHLACCRVTGLPRLNCDADHDCGLDIWTGP